MEWQHKCKIVGQPTITGDRPGSEIEKAVAEIHDNVVAAIRAAPGSGGNVVVTVRVTRPSKNEIVISASGFIDTSEVKGDQGETGPQGPIGPKGDTWYPPSGVLNWLMVWNGSAWVAGTMKAL